MIYATQMLQNLERNTETMQAENRNRTHDLRSEGGIPGTDSHNDAVGLVIPRVRLLLLLQHSAGIFLSCHPIMHDHEIRPQGCQCGVAECWWWGNPLACTGWWRDLQTHPGHLRQPEKATLHSAVRYPPTPWK